MILKGMWVRGVGVLVTKVQIILVILSDSVIQTNTRMFQSPEESSLALTVWVPLFEWLSFIYICKGYFSVFSICGDVWRVGGGGRTYFSAKCRPFSSLFRICFKTVRDIFNLKV